MKRARKAPLRVPAYVEDDEDAEDEDEEAADLRGRSATPNLNFLGNLMWVPPSAGPGHERPTLRCHGLCSVLPRP